MHTNDHLRGRHVVTIYRVPPRRVAELDTAERNLRILLELQFVPEVLKIRSVLPGICLFSCRTRPDPNGDSKVGFPGSFLLQLDLAAIF